VTLLALFVMVWVPLECTMFASSHPGASVMDEIHVPGAGFVVMMPDHCVQGSPGAEFSPNLTRCAWHGVTCLLFCCSPD